MSNVIEITPDLIIPESELSFSASRSGGPGGQNVNKVSSRVTLEFDVLTSTTLSGEQRQLIVKKLASRISKEGILRVVSQRTRSQDMNRSDAQRRFVELLQNALRIEKPRLKTKVTSQGRAERLAVKKQRTQTKRARSKSNWDVD